MAKQFYVALGGEYVEFLGNSGWRTVGSPHDASLFDSSAEALAEAKLYNLHKLKGYAIGEITDAE